MDYVLVGYLADMMVGTKGNKMVVQRDVWRALLLDDWSVV